MIRDGATIATGGVVGIGFAEELAIELENFFLSHQKPHKPRTITTVGLETFVDPRNGGGKINEQNW